MKRVLVAVFGMYTSIISYGQINTLGNNKPLTFLNPALQVEDTENGILSMSYIPSPFVEDVQDAAYLVSAEYNLIKNLRFGANTHRFENRLSDHRHIGVYASYRLPLEEEGSYFILGLNGGYFNTTTKLQEFNKVYAPNKFIYDTDSSIEAETTGFDFGFGMAYIVNGLTVGLAINKLNRPERYAYPRSIISKGTGSNRVISDTTILLDKTNFGLENNLNIVYEWQANKSVSILHSVHLANFGFSGPEYIGLQNVAEFNKKHTLGLGVFHNGSIGYVVTAGFGISEKIRVEGSAFIVEDLNYDPQQEKYINSGVAPIIEGNIQFRF